MSQAENTVLPKSFGERLRWFRNQRGLSQGDLGKAVNRTATSVSEWEKGTSEPSLDQIAALAERLGVSPARLAYGDDGAAVEMARIAERQAQEAAQRYQMAAKVEAAGKLAPLQHLVEAFPPAQIRVVTEVLFERLLDVAGTDRDRQIWLLRRLLDDWPEWLTEERGRVPTPAHLAALAALHQNPGKLDELMKGVARNRPHDASPRGEEEGVGG